MTEFREFICPECNYTIGARHKPYNPPVCPICWRNRGNSIKMNLKNWRDFDTSLALTKEFFEKMKSGEKNIEVREFELGIGEGDKVRFMNGYDPTNGFEIREVKKIERKRLKNLDEDEVEKIGFDSKEDIREFFGTTLHLEVYLFYLKEV